MLRFSVSPIPLQDAKERPLMQSTTGCYYIHIHSPSGISYMKRSITRQAGQPLSNATSSIMTHKQRRALTEASTLYTAKKRMWTEADTTSPATVDYNEQTKDVTPILRSRGLSSGKLNFWWTHHHRYNSFTHYNLSVGVCI